jgi:hypothetical protein
MNSNKLLWTGLTLILAANPVLNLIGLTGSDVIVAVGCVIMIIGLFIMWTKE